MTHVYGCIEWMHAWDESLPCIMARPCSTCNNPSYYYGARDCVYRIYQPGDELHEDKGRCGRKE